ncbi:hypothetical protein HELRODRAFT_193739 [Helobdella robusta]|uniref:Transcriptional repressor p66 coiled-coil MBD2-interaction domain-containing protein n=1 Tax=Helobdella robusta TaxID=6412 RepID=T1FVB0_HELRO|nr:hypothetical protein HELRODRAFT_193739 [Helobdella robusta]ESN94845.1 hypothetical protein HELRODRAFT_193739 [Helobdella robusta]
MEWQDYKTKTYNNNNNNNASNKRSREDFSYFDFENQFNHKKVHMDPALLAASSSSLASTPSSLYSSFLDPYAFMFHSGLTAPSNSTNNGLNSSKKPFNPMADELLYSQFLPNFPGMNDLARMFQEQTSEFALNLSKKFPDFKNLNAMNSSNPTFSKSSSTSQSSSSSATKSDSLPIDLSRRTQSTDDKKHNKNNVDSCLNNSSLSSSNNVANTSNNNAINNSNNSFKEKKERRLMFRSEQDKNKTLKMLKNELKSEESKLLLLKLIKRSQIVFSHNLKTVSSNMPLSTTTTTTTTSSSSSTSTSTSSCNHVSTSKHHSTTRSKSSPDVPGKVPASDSSHKTNSSHYQSNHSTNKHSTAPYNNNNNNNNSTNNNHNKHSLQATNHFNAPSTTLGATYGSTTNAASLQSVVGSSGSRSGTPLQHTTSSITSSTASIVETASQKQAAAKQALRKQLEKTLLQIPLPKPPLSELNFIPNASSVEFVGLMGLEEVVKYIIDEQTGNVYDQFDMNKYIFNPFKCVQCSTDFTAVWKRDKPGSKSVICERCVTFNQKRSLKHEHTNRLKNAFHKAMQQEQEIDKIYSSSSVSPSPTTFLTTSINSASTLNQPLLSTSTALNNTFLAPSPGPSTSSTSTSLLSSSKNPFSYDALQRLAMADLASLTPLFSLPPSLWSSQNFPLGFPPNSAAIAAAQALSQQLFPFPGMLPKSDLTSAHKQFSMFDMMSNSRNNTSNGGAGSSGGGGGGGGAGSCGSGGGGSGGAGNSKQNTQSGSPLQWRS